MYSDELSNILRTALQPVVRFRQFCDARDATSKGLNKGELYTWNVYSDVADQGGELNELDTMPETNYTITQGSLTVTEYGNSVPYTGKLNNLSKQPVSEIINKVLKNDARKALDGAAFTEFNKAGIHIVPTSGTSTTSVDFDDTAATTTTNNVAFGRAHAGLISDGLKERSIPAYTGDDYYAVAWPSTFRALKTDLEDVHKYVETGWQRIMNGEAGRYENIRWIEQTNIAHGGAVDINPYHTAGGTWRYYDNVTSPATGQWNNAASDWIMFFGEDTVAEAICIPEEMRGKIPTDYGRSRGVAWYYLGGFGIVHAGFSNSESRIAKWESAA